MSFSESQNNDTTKTSSVNFTLYTPAVKQE